MVCSKNYVTWYHISVPWKGASSSPWTKYVGKETSDLAHERSTTKSKWNLNQKLLPVLPLLFLSVPRLPFVDFSWTRYTRKLAGMKPMARITARRSSHDKWQRQLRKEKTENDRWRKETLNELISTDMSKYCEYQKWSYAHPAKASHISNSLQKQNCWCMQLCNVYSSLRAAQVCCDSCRHDNTWVE